MASPLVNLLLLFFPFRGVPPAPVPLRCDDEDDSDGDDGVVDVLIDDMAARPVRCG